MAVFSSKSSGRISRLRMQAESLPSVETSLDDFIARANELDPAEQAQFEDQKHREEQDALRLDEAEQTARESKAREESLRRQLATLTDQLADAEALAAIASTSTTRAPSEPPVAVGSGPFERAEIEERVRIAEAKAAKALAAARAASAGLTVSANDLAAIESGLVVPTTPRQGPSWRLVVASLVVGAGVAFAAAFVLLARHDSASALATPRNPSRGVESMQQTPAPALAKPASAPIITPIEQPQPAAPAPADARPAPVAAKPAAVGAKPASIDVKSPPRVVDAKPAPVAKRRPKKVGRDVEEPAKPEKQPSSGIVDPF